MREKDIENLIAQYPEEFFPGQGLRLTGQQIRLGTCYADIIFTDRHKRIVIVEIKRGLLTREAAGQIMEYYGLVKQQEPDKTVELILCANIVPPERREFLERAGIECKELGLSLIQTVAIKHHYRFLDEGEILKRNRSDLPIGQHLTSTPPTSLRVGQSIWIFQANPSRYDVVNALLDHGLTSRCWLVNRYKGAIKRGDIALIWMSGDDAGVYAVADVTSDPVIRADVAEAERYWVDENDRGTQRLRVMLSVRENLVNNPVSRRELREVDDLKHLSILRYSQGTNFPVSNTEWDVIRKKIDEKLNRL